MARGDVANDELRDAAKDRTLDEPLSPDRILRAHLHVQADLLVGDRLEDADRQRKEGRDEEPARKL
jgi:hypothetical protein